MICCILIELCDSIDLVVNAVADTNKIFKTVAYSIVHTHTKSNAASLCRIDPGALGDGV